MGLRVCDRNVQKDIYAQNVFKTYPNFDFNVYNIYLKKKFK